MTHTELVVTAVNAAVVGAVGLALWWAFRGRFEALEKRMDALEERVDRLEGRLDGRIDSLQASVDAIRSDLTAIALAVGARPRAGNQ